MARGFLNSAAGSGGGKNGVFIVDASTLVAGDTVKVQSMIDPTQVWTEEVASGDTYILFEVPGKSYYKISLVQDISDVPTEMVTIFRTLDEGQSVLCNVLNKTTLAGIQAILNAHSELDLLNIGDEVTIHIGGVEHTVEIAAMNLYADHEVIFASKTIIAGGPYSLSNAGYSGQNIRTKTIDWYNSIDASDKEFIKQKRVYSSTFSGMSDVNDYAFIPTVTEITGTNTYNATEQSNNFQFPLFVNQSNRIRKDAGGTARAWYGSSGQTSNDRWWRVLDTGAVDNPVYSSQSCYICPCFHLTADV